MFLRAFALATLMLGATVSVGDAATLRYEFDGGPAVTCKAPNSSERHKPGGAEARYCDDTEAFTDTTGGTTVHVSAMPTYGGHDHDPYGGLGVFDVGIGVGSNGDTRVGPSPGRSKVSRGATPHDDDTIEMLHLGWGAPVEVSSLTVRSYAPSWQSLRIVSASTGAVLVDKLFFSGGWWGPTTTFQFEAPLYGSAFLVEPDYVLEEPSGGFFLSAVEVRPVPVPPALPLLGGAVGLLVWRARRRREG